MTDAERLQLIADVEKFSNATQVPYQLAETLARELRKAIKENVDTWDCVQAYLKLLHLRATTERDKELIQEAERDIERLEAEFGKRRPVSEIPAARDEAETSVRLDHGEYQTRCVEPKVTHD